MNSISINKFNTGYGITTSTYFKLGYPIYSDDEQQYGIFHVAVFGMN